MDNEITVNADASGLARGLADAGAEIDRIAREEIAPAAILIEDAFASAAFTIESRLARAARSGELSLKGLGQAVLQNLRFNLVDSLVRQPLQNVLERALTAPFGGARAEGGFAAPGAAYLVGERGPELFTPGTSGMIAPRNGGGVNVSIHLPGVQDTEGFRRSETQIAAGLARAVSRGARNA